MNYKTMLELAKRNQEQLSKASQIAIACRPATRAADGNRRWLENNQIVEFSEPIFYGSNAEFSIKNQSGQSIWFSQLSKVAIAEDMITSMHSTIEFKAEKECHISDIRTASEFWDAVRGKSFKVKVIGTGFVVNKNNEIAKRIMNGSGLHNGTNAEQKVFNYVRQCIENNRDHEANGLISNYKIYALTEI